MGCTKFNFPVCMDDIPPQSSRAQVEKNHLSTQPKEGQSAAAPSTPMVQGRVPPLRGPYGYSLPTFDLELSVSMVLVPNGLSLAVFPCDSSPLGPSMIVEGVFSSSMIYEHEKDRCAHGLRIHFEYALFNNEGSILGTWRIPEQLLMQGPKGWIKRFSNKEALVADQLIRFS